MSLLFQMLYLIISLCSLKYVAPNRGLLGSKYHI